MSSTITHSEMQQYIEYELAKQPPSLFDNSLGLLRKSNKSVMGTIHKSHMLIDIAEDALFVQDGGNLLHTVPWAADDKCTYKDECREYVSYKLRYYGENAMEVFDGYNDVTSTKIAEQQGRATQCTSAEIIFDCAMKTTTYQVIPRQ